MSYFATEYTIHFDDTMAYGSHHFLTSFKFQCAARESFLFGERVFDLPGVKEALDRVFLLTADAYSRNLNPANLGDRLAILLTLEDWGRVSARFCYRVISAEGKSICAGFQTLICADANSSAPMPLPPALQQAMEAMREIEEPRAEQSFRERVLAGGKNVDSLFGDIERQVAREFLSKRYPTPTILRPHSIAAPVVAIPAEPPVQAIDGPAAKEAWVFAGQAAFDAQLLSARVRRYAQLTSSAIEELNACAAIAEELIGGKALGLVSGLAEECDASVRDTPALSQVAIHLQNVLGAELWRADGHLPSYLMGHSFGEIAALGIAGCFDLQTGIRIVCTRVRAIVDHAPAKGGLLVVSTNRKLADAEAKLLGLVQVVVAGRNNELQTVMSGPTDQLKRLRIHLQKIGISATTIPSPTSFHHPQLQSAAAHWLDDLRRLEIKAPSSKVYSPVSLRFLSATDDIANVLASQFFRPFDLQGGIADVMQAGATTFVDCGSAGMLARLIINAGAEELDVCSVPADGLSDCLLAAQANVTSPVPRELGMSATHNSSAVADLDTNRERSAASVLPSAPAAEIIQSNAKVPRVAIVGQGCILPGGARTPEDLFTAIVDKRVGIVDQRHFDHHWADDFYSQKLAPDRTTSQLTGRVNDDDIVVPPGVDAEVFSNFSRTQQLICIALAPCVASLKGAKRVLCLLGATADGFEDQDDVSSLRFAGIDPCEHDVDLRMRTARSSDQNPHGAVQEVLDRLVRPGIEVTLVDAACASSLYTVALGMQALETNQADAVLAGGFFCPGPGNSCLFSQFRGTTSTGCRPFDAKADGVIFSEGAALITLRRVDDAIRLGIPVQATVLGAGLSSDGKSSSANVPQTKGQLLSLARCYANYNIDPASIDAIEGHGTSTPVGDSTEVETLRQFFADRTPNPIPLHSLKGLLGHAGWAAGTASVIAACEYMRNSIFPAQAMLREPSQAVKQASGTLSVSTSEVALSQQKCRIAIDGFGFGGANAHLVIEKYPAEGRVQLAGAANLPDQIAPENELVFVAFHQEQPAQQAAHFDRQSVKLPKRHVVLPELADDMDISQTLAVILTEKILAAIPQFDDDLRRETSLVLAMSGKTERGVEATMRIMANRFRRLLDGDEPNLQLLSAAYASARPSGAYTLQCMMPNVAAGRAALLHNLNGPNFVVDSGVNSLEAAFLSAQLLLLGSGSTGANLAIVAAIDANSGSLAQPSSSPHEFSAAFAVTTRRFAEIRSLKIIASVPESFQTAGLGVDCETAKRLPREKVQALINALENVQAIKPDGAQTLTTTSKSPPSVPARTPLGSNCQIHGPVWVEKSALDVTARLSGQRVASLLVLVPAESATINELLAVLPTHAERLMVVIVGATGDNLPSASESRDMLYVDLRSTQEIDAAIRRIGAFQAEMVIALDEVTSWDRHEALSSVASENGLCELLFLVAQCELTRLKQGKLELWGLFVNAWRGEVHPQSGAVAGLLKSVNREIPEARTGTICTRGLPFSAAVESLFSERVQNDQEQEIVYDGEVRHVRRLRPTSVLHPQTPLRLDKTSVIVATGGAKGVTAVMLDALLRDAQCTAIVLGRSQLEAGPEKIDDPSVEQDYYRRLLIEAPKTNAREMKQSFESARARWEAHQTMEKLSLLGGRVEYMVADVTDRERIAAVVEKIASRYGRIDLILHGAGVQKSKRLEDRSLSEFRHTYAVKVAGLRNLVQCSQARFGRSVNVHVLSSAYSIFGNDGQHDYGAANETLDRLCTLTEADTSIKWSSIAWLAWDGTGMTRGSEYRALAKKRRLSKVDATLGQQIFREVISGRTGSATNVPMSDAEQIEYGVRTIPASPMAEGGRVLEFDVQLASIKCLQFHRIRETPTLPGAWILDLFVSAGMRMIPDIRRLTNLTVEDTSFSRFVRFANNQEPNVRVVAAVNKQSIDVWMVADVLHPSGVLLSKNVVCASARLSFGLGEQPLTFTSQCAATASQASREVSDPYCVGHRDVDLSGLFDCLSDIRIGDRSRRANFTSSQSLKSPVHFPALLLDAAWRVGAMYAVEDQDDVFVPWKIGRITLPMGSNAGSAPGPVWEIRSTAPIVDSRHVRWDRTEAFDQTGRLKLVVEDAWATRLI